MRGKAFHPLLLASFPPVALYSLNLAMVPLDDLWRPLGITLAASLGFWILASLLMRSINKGAVVVASALALFFSFGPLLKICSSSILIGLDLIVLVLVAVLVRRTERDLAGFTKILNFGSVVLILLPLVQIFEKRPPGRAETFLKVSLPVTATEASTPDKPDIFFIIVDGYGRSDQLKRVMGFSNDAFVGELRKRGFFVAEQGHSTYCQTQLSLTSTLNLSLLQDFPKVFSPSTDNRDALKIGMDKSFLSAYLQKLGYTYEAVTSGFNEVSFRSASLSYSQPLSLSMLESALVQLTPIDVSSDDLISQWNDRRAVLQGAFRNLTYLSKPTGRPRFVVAHILAPHPPFVFDKDGRPVRQSVPFGFWDGSHYLMMGGTKSEYANGYTEFVQYLNGQLLPIIDALVSRGGTKPVVIIEGDHGSKLGLDQDDLAKTDVKECFGNLMAFYVPASVRRKLYPQITSVNTFRVLLDGLFHENLPLLPDRSYYSGFGVPYKFTDVTNQLLVK